MKSMLGLINLYEDESGMGALTRHRPLAAVPYAGRYRLIDFTFPIWSMRECGRWACW